MSVSAVAPRAPPGAGLAPEQRGAVSPPSPSRAEGLENNQEHGFDRLSSGEFDGTSCGGGAATAAAAAASSSDCRPPRDPTMRPATRDAPTRREDAARGDGHGGGGGEAVSLSAATARAVQQMGMAAHIAEPYGSSRVFGMMLDMERGHAQFYETGRPIGLPVPFTAPPHERLYPAVVLAYERGMTATLRYDDVSLQI